MIKAFLNSRRYTKASKLMNAGKYSQALEVLDKFDAKGSYSGKKILFQADILHCKGERRLAIERYLEFLESFVDHINTKKDRDYLKAYAQYFCSQAQTRNGTRPSFNVDRKTVEKLNFEASLLCKGEFPI